VWQLLAWLNPVVTGCYLLLCAGITRCAVLRGSLCLCIVSVVERCDLTKIKGKIYFFFILVMGCAFFCSACLGQLSHQPSVDGRLSISSWAEEQGCGVLVFCGIPTPGLENLGRQTTTAVLKNLDSDSNSGPKSGFRLRLLVLLRDIMIMCLRMT